MSQEKSKPKTRADLLAKVKAANPDYIERTPIQIHPQSNELSQHPFSAVKPQRINWLWDQRIARGKVSLFAGEPGKGKSQLLLWIASACTNAAVTPVDGFTFPQGKVAILASEDDEDDTMWPRLKAVNANLEHILQLKSTPKYDQQGNLQDDMVRLDEDMQKLDNTFTNNAGYVLLIIDPITAYVGDINDYKNSEVRTLISKLTRIAKKHNIAVILNTHLTKQNGNQPLTSIINRVTGSLAYAAAARSVYLICDDLEDPKFKLFLPIKNNIGIDTGGFKYSIQGVIVKSDNEEFETCRIQWTNDVVDISANDAMTKTSSPKLDEAMEFLEECLKNGTCAVKDVRTRAKAANISVGMLYNARDKLKVIEDYTLDRPRLTTWALPNR